jgi:hypothetical protein
MDSTAEAAQAALEVAIRTSRNISVRLSLERIIDPPDILTPRPSVDCQQYVPPHRLPQLHLHFCLVAGVTIVVCYYSKKTGFIQYL